MINIIPVKFKPLYENVKLPQYATEFSSGFDLIIHNFKQAYSSNNQSIGPIEFLMYKKDYFLLLPHSRILVGCGYALEIPAGKELQIRSRSGLAFKSGICMANGVGTVDSDYRGEMSVLLLNSSEFAYQITIGDRVAQAIIVDHCTASFEIVDELSETKRGEGGFGHTGK